VIPFLANTFEILNPKFPVAPAIKIACSIKYALCYFGGNEF